MDCKEETGFERRQPQMTNTDETIAWLAEYIYTGGRFERNLALVCDSAGNVTRLARESDVTCEIVRLKNRALLPGMINAHSHAFQRVIRGKTEHRSKNSKDSFWTWREMMYRAAARLTPEDIYDASRMAFLEMALGGITSVGEFHYLHRDQNGAQYDDPNLLAKEVIRAARDVGVRIALLRVAYARSGFQVEANERQKRFIEAGPDTYLRNVERLRSDLLSSDAGMVWVGLAPHSIRAVPLDYLRDVVCYGENEKLQVHMHVAEQPAENESCLAEHGRTVVNLLADENILRERFTCVHAVHVTEEEARRIAIVRAFVCACPTTERNLGDGIVPADVLLESGVRVAFGTDSHTQIDLLEDARQLEYNLRITKLQRNVLAPESPGRSALAMRLFDGATMHGASSIGSNCGALSQGQPADFFTLDLNDPSIAGASQDDLLSSIVFSLARTAIRDVFVGGKRIIENGRHAEQDKIVENFAVMQDGLWG
jgi:formimidoylglutamate deiminase